MIPEYLTGSHREGIEVPFRPFLFLIHVTLRCWLNAFHNANNWLRPLLWHYVPNINTLQRALAPLSRPIVAPSSLLGCLINVHQLFFHFFFIFFLPLDVFLFLPLLITSSMICGLLFDQIIFFLRK